MSYVGGPFAYDLFVSYSHSDDGSGKGCLQPWSAAFARELESELNADRKFRPVSVFLDNDHRPGQSVDPMAPLTDQLRRQIGESALLLVLMSPDYLASTWCADERDWWCAAQAELGFPVDERIAVVRIWPTDVPWPEVMTDSQRRPQKGFPFYARDQIPVRPLGWTEMPGPFGTEFRKALLDIVGRLYPKLEGIKRRVTEAQKAREEAARLARSGGQMIYLHGRADHADVWERSGIALTESGFGVVPGDPDPVESNPLKLQEVRERRVEALSGCDALLLVGTDDGRALDADLVVVGKHDRHSARARSNRMLPCGLLDTVGGAIATRIRKATARIIQAEWIDGTQPEWTPNIQRWLAEQGVQAEDAP